MLNPNEIRAMENRGPYAGGEVYTRPVNTAAGPARRQQRAGAGRCGLRRPPAPSCASPRTEAGAISGYAAIWGRRDPTGTSLRPGAFAASLAAHRAAGTRPLMLWSHDPREPVGVWTDVREDATGLRVEGRLVLDATAGRDAHAMVRAGAIDGSEHRLPHGPRRGDQRRPHRA